MSDIENRIAETLVAHIAKTMCAEGDGFYTECRCGEIGHVASDAEDWEPANQWVAAHQAAMLAPLIAEAQAHERHHVTQQIRETAEHESSQIGDYGRVELEGYFTITDSELYSLENDTGADRMCMTVEQWEADMHLVQAGAWDEGVAVALNHAILNEDGMTLRLEHLDGRTWANPYRAAEIRVSDD